MFITSALITTTLIVTALIYNNTHYNKLTVPIATMLILTALHRTPLIFNSADNINLSNIAQVKYSKTSLNRPTMGPNLTGPFREVIGLGSWNTVMGDYLVPK